MYGANLHVNVNKSTEHRRVSATVAAADVANTAAVVVCRGLQSIACIRTYTQWPLRVDAAQLRDRRAIITRATRV